MGGHTRPLQTTQGAGHPILREGRLRPALYSMRARGGPPAQCYRLGLDTVAMSCSFQRKFLRPRWVVSDEGFEVRFLGVMKVRYSEAERSVWFWAEPVIIEQGE